MKKQLAVMVGTAVLALIVASPAPAESLPSAKAAASLGDIYALGTASAVANQGSSVSAKDTGWVTIVKNQIKTPNLHDLSLDVAMQCGINTFTLASSKGGTKTTAVASGDVSVRVKLTLPDGSVRYALPSEEGNPDAGVTFCSRVQELSATFQGIITNCIAADGTIHLDDTCLLPEEVSLLLKSMNASSFNFLAPDVPPGIQTIEVQARGRANSDLFSSTLGQATGEAFVGAGSVRVETIRMIKNADIDPVPVD